MTLRTITNGRLVDWEKIDNLPADTNAALAWKQATLVSGTNIKTINWDSILWSWDLVVGWGWNITGTLTANELVYGTGANDIASLAVATYPSLTEISYVKWVTSAIQTQLNAKWTGNVSKVGTPVDNQIGVWTGDGTIEWDANLTFDTSTDTLTTVNTVLQTVKASGSWWVEIKNSWGTDVIITGAWGGTGTSITGTTNIASASADYHQVAWGTGTITDTATGSSTDININLVPKGTGRLQAGGVNVPTVLSSDTLTNKTLTSPVINVTSDATWDLYYRNAWWLFTRLPVWTTWQVLTTDGTTPSRWAASWWGGWFWTTVPWTPTRTSDTVFTITDTANANAYDQLLQRGTVLKRTQSWTKQAMVVSATYAANTVTVTLIWDTFAAGFSDVKYGLEKARMYKSALAWTIGATGNNVMNTQMVESPSKIYWADFRAGTAWNGTTTVDINKWGSSMFATRPSILTTNQNILWVTADTGTTATTGDYITVDVDAVAGTTKIIDAYVNLYYLPLYMASLA